MKLSLRKVLAHLFQPGRSNNQRPRILHPEALLVLTLLVGIFATGLLVIKQTYNPFANILGYASNITPAQVVELTNQQRASHGLPPLNFSPTLSQAAQAKGQDMLNQQYWAHTSPAGKEPWDFINQVGYSYTIAGENLARDFSTTSNMVEAWMASPTHRANIVNARYSEIGIAVINGSLEGTDTTVVVQMFGAPRSVAAAPTTTNQAAQTSSSPAPSPAPTNSPQPTSTPQPTATPTPEPTFNLAEEQVVSLDASQIAGNSNFQPSRSAEANQPQVLAQFLVPIGELNPYILFSPVELAKAFGLAVSILLVAVLIYDLYLAHKRKTVRIVGKNLGHIMLLLTVIFLLIFLKGGVVG